MARDPKYDILFEPIKIGPKVLPNRFYQVPQCLGAGSERPGLQMAHRAVKAEGGWGGVSVEFCSITPESDATDKIGVRLWDSDDVRNLRPVCDAVHEHGALVGAELWYGQNATGLETRIPPRGPSVFGTHGGLTIYPRQMDAEDIALVQSYYVDAALRAREAGFDIIEIYGTRNQLPILFLSPWSNRRTDRYGGSFENRARFWRETLERIREAVGDDCAISARFVIDQLMGSRGVELNGDGLRFIEHVDHLVDVWSVSIDSPGEGGQGVAVSRYFAENHEQRWTGCIKLGNHTDKPVIGVGRITNPDTMAAIIRSGQWDIIGAARASIADPFLPNKIRDGHLDDIRECIGCNICFARWETGGPPIVCTQNATAGEEYRRGWHPERFAPARNRAKTVVVVGGGPAGMECAMILGKRDMHAVHLVEAGDGLGGSLRWISRLGHVEPRQDGVREAGRGLGEWHRVVDYRQVQLAKLRNTEVHLNSRLDANNVLGYGAEIVIIATGCHFATDGLNPVTREPIPGADTALSWQFTPEQVVPQIDTIGDRVLVFDTEGYFMGSAIAELLAGRGRQVHLVTQAEEVGSYMNLTLEMPMARRQLHRLGVKLYTSTMLDRIAPGVCHLSSLWDSDRTDLVEVDAVVLATQRISDRSLYDELRTERDRTKENGIEGVYLIGDAAAPRMIVDNIFDGHRLAREIDSSSPATPLPFIRERRLWSGRDEADYQLAIRDPAPV